MTDKSTKRGRPLRFLAVSAVAAIAMLVLAGPASAHHGRHNHRRHHRQMFDPQQGPAGTIASFDETTGKLTITLSEGETITGFVTEDTRIEIAGACDHQGSSQGDQGDQDWQGSSGGDQQLWEHWDSGQPGEATTADLKPGTEVEDAVLIVAGGKATFAKIDLAPPSTEQPASTGP